MISEEYERLYAVLSLELPQGPVESSTTAQGSLYRTAIALLAEGRPADRIFAALIDLMDDYGTGPVG